MTDLSRTHVIAVDGGGTRCRVALSDGKGMCIVETGPTNVSTDLNGSVRQITQGLQQLAEQAGVALDDLANLPAYLGLAGMTGDDIAARLAAALPFTHVRIADDRAPALRGALGNCDGIVVHCGTGSFAGAQMNAALRLVGGWGPVLGDVASAQWVGRRALSRSLDARDGLIAQTALTRDLQERFGSTAAIVAFAGTASPADFGAFARDVTRHAETGDAAARAILQEATDNLVAICHALGWTAGMPLCLTGGIAPHYARYLTADMRTALIEPKGAPLSGAVAMARDFAMEIADERR